MMNKAEAAQFLGRLGGRARAKALSPARRSEIAKKAVAKRIEKYNQKRGGKK